MYVLCIKATVFRFLKFQTTNVNIKKVTLNGRHKDSDLKLIHRLYPFPLGQSNFLLTKLMASQYYLITNNN